MVGTLDAVGASLGAGVASLHAVVPRDITMLGKTRNCDGCTGLGSKCLTITIFGTEMGRDLRARRAGVGGCAHGRRVRAGPG